MKKSLLLLVVPFFVSCASIDLPTVEESQMKISNLEPQLELVDKNIDSKTANLPKDSELDMVLRQDVINRIFNAIAKHKDVDITINFLATKGIWKEDKRVLGIEYSNYFNVEKGSVNMDLKKLRFLNVDNNMVEAQFEIEGEGKITVSAKHTGIPATVTSDINLYLNENVKFKIGYSDKGSILLKPQPKKMKLKTRFAVNLSKASIPWREEIELDFADVLPPVEVPVALATELSLPIPSKARKAGTFQDVPHEVKFSKVNLKAEKGTIRWRSAVDFKKK